MYEDHFLHVDDATTIDRTHQFILKRGRFDQSGPPYTQSISVHYDGAPESALDGPFPQDSGRSPKGSGKSDVIKTTTSIDLFDFVLEVVPDPSRAELQVTVTDDDFALKSRILNQRVPLPARSSSFDFCSGFLVAATEMPTWDAIVRRWNSNPNNASRQVRTITFLINSTLARKLGTSRGIQYEKAGDGDYILLSREAQS